jgi:class 3 adenylate cyclase
MKGSIMLKSITDKIINYFLYEYIDADILKKRRVRLFFIVISAFIIFTSGFVIFELVLEKNIVTIIPILLYDITLFISFFLFKSGKYSKASIVMLLCSLIAFPCFLMIFDSYSHPFEMWRITAIAAFFTTVGSMLLENYEKTFLIIINNIGMITLVYIYHLFVKKDMVLDFISISTYFSCVFGLWALSYMSLSIMKIYNTMIAEISLKRDNSLKKLKILELYSNKSLIKYLENENNSITSSQIEKNISVLTLSIKNFYSITKRLNSSDIVKFLNDYFDKIGTTILINRGDIDRISGNDMTIIFDNADDSIKASIQIKNIINEFNENIKLRFPQLGIIDIAIGIDYGKVVRGNIVSINSMNYLLIGDALEISSTLNNLSKYYSTPILITGEVKKNLKGDYYLRFIDKIELNNRVISIYESYDYQNFGVIKLKQSISSDLENAYKYYTEGIFEKAYSIYSYLAENKTDDPLIKFYMKRSQLLEERKKTGLLNNWNGISDFSKIIS